MGTRNTNTRCVESMMRTRRRRSAMSALLVIVGSVFAPGMVVIDHPGADVIPHGCTSATLQAPRPHHHGGVIAEDVRNPTLSRFEKQ